MLERKKIWLVALAAAVAAFFYENGAKLTISLSGFTAWLGIFTVSQWGVIVGIFLGFASFILTWIYKQKYLDAIRKHGAKTALKEGIE